MSNDEVNRVKTKLYTKFSKKEVKSSGDIASLYDLKSSICESIESYNNFFDKKRKNILKTFSKNKNLPVVSSVDFVACNSPRIIVNFCEFGYTYSLVIRENMFYEIYKDLFSNVPNLNKTILKCKKDLLESISMLKEFNLKYPEIDYSFSIDFVNKNGKFVYKDDDFKYEFSLDKPSKVIIEYNDYEDNMIALIYDDEIFDYINFYNDEILKKTEININDVSNPLYSYFLRKYLALDKEKTLKL